MRPCPIKVGHIRLENTVELPLMQDQQVIKTFLTNTSQEPLTDGIGSRRVIGGFENLDVTCPRHTVKARPELTVVIANQIFGRLPIRRGFPELLGHPGIGRRACHPYMDDPSCLEFDEEEGEEWSKEEIGDLEARHRPRCSPRDCAEMCSTFALVDAACECSSCTSEWFACTPECQVSTIPLECVRPPRADSPWPSA